MRGLTASLSLLFWLTACGTERTETYPSDRCVGDLCYRLEGDLAVAEGDIIVGTGQQMAELAPRARSGFAAHVSLSWARWPQGRIPYLVHSKLPDASRVQQAIDHYHQYTKIRFVPRTTQTAYIVFKPWTGGYCRSWIGRTGTAQAIDLEGLCNQRSVIHEIGHAVGLWHEHTRPDRDQYVKVHLANVLAGLAVNLNRRTTYGQKIGAYDLASVMHYRPYELSSNGQPTITRLDGSVAGLSNPDGLSPGDIATLKQMYP